MAANPKLIKDWIQYLKNNRIVALQSDPNSGKLTYKRAVTSDDLVKFLNSTGKFDEDDIDNAIAQVLGQAPGTSVSAEPNNQQSGKPQQSQAPSPSNVPQVGKKKFNNDDAEDINFRNPSKRSAQQIGNTRQIGYTPTEEPKQEPEDNNQKQLGWARKPRFKLRNVKEAFKDEQGSELTEEQVEEIFEILSKGAPRQQGQQHQEDPAEKKKRELAKIQELITNTMSPGQRKAFFLALNDGNLLESYIDKKEINQIFKTVSDYGGFLNLRKGKISIDDLQKAWKLAGYPDDTDDIGRLLYKQFGFNKSTIHKIFIQVIGDDYNDTDVNGMSDRRYQAAQQDTKITPALQQLIDYVKKSGLTDDLIEFMKQNFGDELQIVPEEPQQKKPGVFQRSKNLFKRRATTEDVKQIFTSILGEERESRLYLLKQLEHTQLGRIRK